ncbi:hypothetical protein L917_17796 [Phytophthora nicotianae]|uniref:Uncharacterized protein n=2 Tax=Phytophthora nicotianae TaxID=4792 RepID=V9E7S0_PHYNI|nr:hypothetical protein F443_18580 [Phytophthora nicotianae P1569]ETK75309.1 hypothetical protein L915_18068 [Phytophthora nicotianae]ETL81978.1 hypothetical protein L917_17796 [Phytophthora nicotianae]ETM35184.1 hypothetical protein L914_17881 [Phytophthora nicotianae]
MNTTLACGGLLGRLADSARDPGRRITSSAANGSAQEIKHSDLRRIPIGRSNDQLSVPRPVELLLQHSIVKIGPIFHHSNAPVSARRTPISASELRHVTGKKNQATQCWQIPEFDGLEDGNKPEGSDHTVAAAVARLAESNSPSVYH